MLKVLPCMLYRFLDALPYSRPRGNSRNRECANLLYCSKDVKTILSVASVFVTKIWAFILSN
jgi:hypothetical protein